MGSSEVFREKLVSPQGIRKALLHCCCVACAGDIVESMLASGVIPTLFFYNPNIDSLQEYQKRKKFAENFALKKKIDFVDGDYFPQDWSLAIKGLEGEPEGGKRCEKCFELRLGKAAHYAAGHGFQLFTSTLGISRFKNFEKITVCGKKVAGQYAGLIYWDYNWRKKGGSERMYKIAKDENFYMQGYCGCVFSLEQAKRRHDKNKE